jgi:UDP-N-acetylmuramate--alanine ligase
MTDLKNSGSLYFLGIGGIGMSALARYFHALGKKVQGYDRTPTLLTQQLQQEGIAVHYDDDPANITTPVDLVIYTPAIPMDNAEMRHFLRLQTPLLKRAEVLGMLTHDTYTLAVAGTHGKTTITSLIAHILNTAGKKVTAFIGGISKNFHSNLLLTTGSDIMVAEADEYDRSFLNLYPDVGVITSMDADHLDVYVSRQALIESFAAFASHVKSSGTLVLKEGLPLQPGMGAFVIRYGAAGHADVFVTGYRARDLSQFFNLSFRGRVVRDLRLGLPGLFNVENAMAAIAAVHPLDIAEEDLREALATFTGVERRFDIRINRPQIIYVDDYAHHPRELNACISTARGLFPRKKLTGIFQPHLYSRTRDLADDFASSLENLDEIILLDIYPAREQPLEGVNAGLILNKIHNTNKILLAKEELLPFLAEKEREVVITMGAGDIDQLVAPLERLFKEQYRLKNEPQ